eukprot:UN07213
MKSKTLQFLKTISKTCLACTTVNFQKQKRNFISFHGEWTGRADARNFADMTFLHT